MKPCEAYKKQQVFPHTTLGSCSVMSGSLQPHGLRHTRLPCPYHPLELAQTHVHWVSDATKPSCPLLLPSPPTLNLSHHQGLFHTTVGSSKLWSPILPNTLINSSCLCSSHPSEHRSGSHVSSLLSYSILLKLARLSIVFSYEMRPNR